MRKNSIVVVALGLALLLFAVGCGQKPAPAAPPTPAPAAPGPSAPAAPAPAAPAPQAKPFVYPHKRVDLIIPFGAGSDPDLSARVLAKALEKILNITIVPVNIPASGGAAAYEEGKTRSGDGSTLIWITSSLMTNQHMKQISFTHKELTPIALTETQQAPITVKGDAPWKTLEEFVAAAKAANPPFKAAAGGFGSGGHIAVLSYAATLGIPVNFIPGPITERTTALLRGDVQWMVPTVGDHIDMQKSGQIRFLAMSMEKRHDMMPTVPTMKDLGYKEFHYEFWRGIMGPPGMSDELRINLSQAVEKAVQSAEYVDFKKRNGQDVRFLPTDQFKKFLNDEDVWYGDLFKKHNIQPAK